MNEPDEDFVPMDSPFGAFRVVGRWGLLVTVVLAHIILSLFTSGMHAGYTLGVATAPVFWGCSAV